MSTHVLKAEQARDIISYDPATGEEIGRVPLLSPEAVIQAVARARAAQPAWANLSFKERGRVILKAREILLAQMDEVATLISRETRRQWSSRRLRKP